eukprot:11492-Heterococcus_DN1.PRE.1
MYSSIATLPLLAALLRTWTSSHGQPCSRKQRSVSGCPPLTAYRHADGSEGHCCCRRLAHSSVWPFLAAAVSTAGFSAPWDRCSTHAVSSTEPLLAAAIRISLESQGHLFSRAHCSAAREPLAAASLHTSTPRRQPAVWRYCSVAALLVRAACTAVSVVNSTPCSFSQVSTAMLLLLAASKLSSVQGSYSMSAQRSCSLGTTSAATAPCRVHPSKTVPEKRAALKVLMSACLPKAY